jgi:DNA-binding NtrC family response regulator
MKLLRVLESFKFEPVGSNVTQEVNVRLILASNQDLADLVKEGKFREDLYYRVNVMNVYLPPLRERREDIAPLATHFIEKYRHEAIHPVENISDEAMRILTEFNWPGNVRELENVIRRAVVLCRTSTVMPVDLPPKMVPNATGPVMMPDGQILPLKAAMRKWERQLILEGLKATGGNRKEAAKQLKINRTTLYNKMREHEISEKDEG